MEELLLRRIIREIVHTGAEFVVGTGNEDADPNVKLMDRIRSLVDLWEQPGGTTVSKCRDDLRGVIADYEDAVGARRKKSNESKNKSYGGSQPDDRYVKASKSSLMLDKPGMEKSDRENVERYLKAMNLID